MPRAGAWWLSELVGRKIEIECECGVKKRYDAKAMLRRIGDRSMPALLAELAIANGCDKTANRFYDRCRLAYRYALPDEENRLSRLIRPVMRRRPVLRTKSPSPIYRNGISFTATAAHAAARAGLTGARWREGSARSRRSWRWRGTCDVQNAATRMATPSRSAESSGDSGLLTPGPAAIALPNRR